MFTMSGHNFRWMRPDARVSWTYSTRTAAEDVGQPMPAGSTLQESPDNGETWLDPGSGGSVASAALATTLDEHRHADESEADDLDHGQNQCVSLSVTAEKQLSKKDNRPDRAHRSQRDHHRPCAPGVPAAKDHVEHLAAPHPTTRNRNSPVTIG